MSEPQPVTIRRATDADLDRVIDLCASALAWAEPELDRRFFVWKHRDNPFGPSPVWVAEEEGPEGSTIVAVRAMMRWALEGPGAERWSMTRAVDTATAPSHQGRGLFSRLTLTAVDELTAEGASAVFNTPNDKSRPGYLKMGWQLLGKVPVSIQPRSPRDLWTMQRSRTAARKWGEPTEVGLDPAEALSDPEAVSAALDRRPAAAAPRTALSVDYLRWRTGFAELACRVWPLGATMADGFVVFRLRRRGELLQLSLLHVVAPGRSVDLARAVRHLLGATGAQVVLGTGRALGPGSGMVAVSPIGPQLTWRPLARSTVPRRGDLDLDLGTIELF